MSNIVKRGFQPLFFKGVDEKFPPDKERVIIVMFDGTVTVGYLDWKTNTWYVQIGSYTEPIDRSGVACWSSFNPNDIFGKE